MHEQESAWGPPATQDPRIVAPRPPFDDTAILPVVTEEMVAAADSATDAPTAYGQGPTASAAVGEQAVGPAYDESIGAAAPDEGLVDLNTADAATLETLPGVGPVLAGRIVTHRDERPFTTVDELDEVPGIGPALMRDLRPLVRV